MRLREDGTSVDKRTFLKLCSSTVATRFLAVWLGRSPRTKLSNWAGNVEYSTDRQFSPTSLKEIQQFVKSRSSVKTLGTRHCFNQIADSTDEFLSLRQMDRVVRLDPKARTVTIESGMTYGELCPYLDSKGWALHNLASWPQISIAGA